MSHDPGIRTEIDRIYREEYGRVVASLARRFGDIDVAEDAAAEALLTAIERWPVDGIPPNPGGWLTKTAGNRAIDRIRRAPTKPRSPRPSRPTTPPHADDSHGRVGRRRR